MPESPKDTQPTRGDVIDGKYRLEQLLGQGGMGRVFAAVHTLTHKRVAVKFLDPELVKRPGAVGRFVREAQAAARIEHPNVVDVYDFGQHRGVPFLVMELLRGSSLGELLAKGPLMPADAVRVLMPAIRGLAATHERGIVHRDLKPDNLFVCMDETGTYVDTKIVDFGLSKVIEPLSNDAQSLTAVGSFMGTPEYMAPEQMLDSKRVDARADVYAMGVIVYEALAGHLPVQADTRPELMLRVTTGQLTPLHEHRPDVSEALEVVVMRALARNPDQRVADMRTLGVALEPFGDGVRFEVPPGWQGPEPLDAEPTHVVAAPTRRRTREEQMIADLDIEGLLTADAVRDGDWTATSYSTDPDAAPARPSLSELTTGEMPAPPRRRSAIPRTVLFAFGVIGLGVVIAAVTLSVASLSTRGAVGRPTVAPVAPIRSPLPPPDRVFASQRPLTVPEQRAEPPTLEPPPPVPLAPGSAAPLLSVSRPALTPHVSPSANAPALPHPPPGRPLRSNGPGPRRLSTDDF